MFRKIQTTAAIFICFLGFSGWAEGSTIEKLAKKLEKDILANSPKRVAVLSFPYLDGKTNSHSLLVQERLTTLLAKRQKVELVERRLLEKVIGEMKLEQTGMLDDKTTQQVGKLLGAGAVITGTLNRLNADQIEVNARAIETGTGRILSAGQCILAWTPDSESSVPVVRNPGLKPVVQIAILLDTSNSMDGLIQQAKSQLWKIVQDLAYSQKYGMNPTVQVALYEYGNSRLSMQNHYLRQVLPFTSDLDRVSESLFQLSTNGGQEYCGAVIEKAAQELLWDPSPETYKAIFIAGNESFAQGTIRFESAIALARQRGVFVNTIYCGSEQEGISLRWDEGARLARSRYFNINSDQIIAAIPAPQDDEIRLLGERLNDSFIALDAADQERNRLMIAQDKTAVLNKAAGTDLHRTLFKASSQYRSEDGLNRYKSGALKLESLSEADIPKELKGMSLKQQKAYLEKKYQERMEIKNRLAALNEERKKYLAEKESLSQGGSFTLDQAMRSAIHTQAGNLNYVFTEKSGRP